MRTGLFVYKPSTITITESSHGGAQASIMAYRRQGILQPIGTLQLDAGIYQVLSETPVEISGGDVDTVTINRKDNVPELPPRALALEPGASQASLGAFFGTAKDASPDD